ncbi:mandelate racemase/muconate lactonizing enzyme family protein [Halocatena salina]|uniref:Mandelate racemase/muconate lactonizing enzyme family protein n=1 Tax=Halocatena salina TaxID=2934340 RepID=A0A8U0A520_9EURY|nr:mandelate racemase/muconate lactonizing enzyme family protein [Halocatena salina]UPM44295.1 mandelate racemase/muconate lactonizing enzyme family protein [Halocatena salina]
MDIVSVSGYALSSPIDPVQERPFFGGVRRLHKRDVVLVVVETSDGRRGVSTAGASSSAMREYFEGDSHGTFADVVETTVADALEGRSIEEITDAHELLRATDLPSRLRTEAISAIDVALYDLRGKEVGAPIYELLATAWDTEPTTELPLYASAGMYMEPEGYVEQATVLEELGFFGYKYRPGIGPDADRRTVELLATAVDDIELMLDVHTWWKLRDSYGRDTVRALVEHAADRGVYWIEEPVEPDDHEGYVELADTGAPLAGGESEKSPSDLITLGRTGVDFLQGDVRHHEGFTGCQAAIEFCVDRNIEFVPHNFGTWLGLQANAHLVAAAPEAQLLEYPVFEDDPALAETETDPGMYPFELAFDIIEGQPVIENGRMTVPDAPGLGVDVDLSVLESYPFIDGPWTEFHY